MSKAFEKCVRRKGEVTIINGKNKHFNVPDGHYRRICIIGDKTTQGPLKKKK